jgi:hypothetical protein
VARHTLVQQSPNDNLLEHVRGNGISTSNRFVSFGGANDAYGLLSARFTYAPPGSNWDISLFGTNLTNEVYRMGVDQGYVGRPRELGVTLSLRL